MHNSIEVLVAKMENMAVPKKILKIQIAQCSSSLRDHEVNIEKLDTTLRGSVQICTAQSFSSR